MPVSRLTARIASLPIAAAILFLNSAAGAGPYAAPGHLRAGPSGIPEIAVGRISSNSVPLYGKFEVLLEIKNAGYVNPFNPEEIDVRAVFRSPSGKIREIFGFYDDYQNADAWKVRFSPNETGEWTFRASASNRDGTGQSGEERFTAIASDHHGWVRVSSDNPRYLVHDDGTPFFGVGAYLPWGESISKLDQLMSRSANFYAIWNIPYGGMMNGNDLIESELGRYHQPKCGRLDSLLSASESRGLHVMFCIWPHDLFCKSMPGWAAQWSRNPYNQLCDVKDVYADAQAWDYQKKLYRYLIARYGHSRSLAVWEIVNEIDGTDGWAAGRRAEAIEWVRKVDEYLNQNDPFQRPTTASMSGGYTQYNPNLYSVCDMPNRHIYETQGWTPQYPGNLLRSSMKNFADAAKRFRLEFAKPALFGEAGYTATYYPTPNTPEYTAVVHNALWASLTNGLSVTPVWWDSGLLSSNDWAQYTAFAEFVERIDFIREARDSFESVGGEFDIFGMKGDSAAFGWIRDVYGRDVSGKTVVIQNALNPAFRTCRIRYFNTWTGEWLGTNVRPSAGGSLVDALPSPAGGCPDMAFRIEQADGATIPTRIKLSTVNEVLLNISGEASDISCFLVDGEGRVCAVSGLTISFLAEGPGSLEGANPVSVVEGTAGIRLVSGSRTGPVLVIASSPGLVSDTLVVTVTDRAVLDDFEEYLSDMSLQTNWITQSGTQAKAVLEHSVIGGGDTGMRLEYGVGGSAKSYARIVKRFSMDCSRTPNLNFWFKPDGSSHDMKIRIRDADVNVMDYVIPLSGTEAETRTIPLSEFVFSRDSVDVTRLAEIEIRIDKGAGPDGTFVLYFDDFGFLTDSGTDGVDGEERRTFPGGFALMPNYPNPFNHATVFEYSIPEACDVRITVNDLLGRRIAEFTQGGQAPGRYAFNWNAAGAVSGIYFVAFKAGDFTARRKCVLLK